MKTALLSPTAVEACLAKMKTARIGVVGDFCLDAYWALTDARAEISLETGLRTRTVKSQRYAPGGAGNVAMNLLALGVPRVNVFGVAGSDPFGATLRELLANAGADTRGFVTQDSDWATHVYAKPMRGGNEEPRFDFGLFNRLADATRDALLGALENAFAETLDCLVVNDQVVSGIHADDAFRRGLQSLIDAHPDVTVIVDGRHFGEHYRRVCRKLNLHEACRMTGIAEPEPARFCEPARALFDRCGKPIWMTCGEHGAIAIASDECAEAPPIKADCEIDTVGAGDSFLSGVAGVMACRGSVSDAAAMGTLVAGVTIRKCGQTGTATPDEILALVANSSR